MKRYTIHFVKTCGRWISRKQHQGDGASDSISISLLLSFLLYLALFYSLPPSPSRPSLFSCPHRHPFCTLHLDGPAVVCTYRQSSPEDSANRTSITPSYLLVFFFPNSFLRCYAVNKRHVVYNPTFVFLGIVSISFLLSISLKLVINPFGRRAFSNFLVIKM